MCIRDRAIAGAVADGHLTFDTAAHQVFEWWSSSPTDPRSGVTLRQLLSFTSGFYWPDASSGNCSCMGLVGGFTFSSEDCARQIYSQAPFKYKAGTTWAYNSFHLQIAGAMAAKAAGVTVQELLHRYLIGKLSLKSTGWLLGRNPVLAAGMHTTPTDYDRILSAYLSYELLPEQVAREMERDYLANGTKLCDWCPELTGSLGDYSMCNWYECIRDKPGEPFSKQCRDANVHNDAGLFGYYPVFDRTKAMYMQIAQSVLVGLNDTNPGVNGAMELRQLVKPAVDDALTSGTQASVQSQAAGLPANVSQVSRVPSEWLNYPELPATYWNDLVDSFARMDL
eukprot:TRINITY_DN2732_c0_g2_i2.p1 TRINITY_DN2732_c0_g2~~TRINITY_DN2732_c0_g2_i2.p1  ORF type:complete len:338 (-),score=63.01 TRINITY_DN2732_c0_g2_i2:311-1324(-)